MRSTVAPVISRVHAIHIAPGRKVPTKSVDSVEAEAGVGLVGDRYHGARHRHVTVQDSTTWRRRPRCSAGVDAGLTRRNITLTTGPIPTRPGERMRIADVDLEVVRIAAPCRLLDDWLGPGAMQALRSPRGGTVFRLLGSGTTASATKQWRDPSGTRCDAQPGGGLFDVVVVPECPVVG